MARVLRRLALIDVSQRAGLSLDEIRELLDAGSEPIAPHMQELAAKKLPEVEALIQRAEAMRDWLKAAQGCGCESVDECGLFDTEPAGAESATRSAARGRAWSA